MKVDKVRIGFATNSSSSHSMIVLPSGVPMPSSAHSAEQKDEYLMGLIGDAFGLWGDKLQKKMIKHVSGDFEKRLTPEIIDSDWYWGLPSNWSESGPCWPYMKDFRAYLQREDVAVFVWDRDYEHPCQVEGVKESRPFSVLEQMDEPYDYDKGCSIRKRFVARKDGAWWTIFSRQSGLKIRMSFEDDAEPLAKGETPELVDIKITDYCPIGCHFCYQGSTKEGLHATFSAIENVAESMRDMEVFEVAIGGGEPTMHPQFVESLQAFHVRGVVPNFTTRSMAWFKDEAVVHAVLAFCGGFAFSVDTREQAERVCRAVPDKLREKLVFHHVMGTASEDEFRSLVQYSGDWGIPITLLGYKTTGRGSEFDPVEYRSWFDRSVFEGRRVSIDTALAAQVKDRLDELEVPEWCYHLEEGKTSMYIDCVKRSVAPSSFCGPEYERRLEKLDMVSIREGWSEIEPVVVS